MLFLSVFDLIVTDSAQRLDKHHDCRDARTRNVGRVMQRAGWQAMNRAGGLAIGRFAEVEKDWMERHRLDVPDAGPVDSAALFACEGFTSGVRLAIHLRKDGGV